jgi:hypothetical protein
MKKYRGRTKRLRQPHVKRTVTPIEELRPEDGNDRIRGLLRADYTRVSRLVRNGGATWYDLEDRGIVFSPASQSEIYKRVKRMLHEQRRANAANK